MISLTLNAPKECYVKIEIYPNREYFKSKEIQMELKERTSTVPSNEFCTSDSSRHDSLAYVMFTSGTTGYPKPGTILSILSYPILPGSLKY